MIHAVGILIGNKTKKKKRLFFGGLQGSRITKMGLLVFISDKNKKKGKKVRAASFGLRLCCAPHDFSLETLE